MTELQEFAGRFVQTLKTDEKHYTTKILGMALERMNSYIEERHKESGVGYRIEAGPYRDHDAPDVEDCIIQVRADIKLENLSELENQLNRVISQVVGELKEEHKDDTERIDQAARGVLAMVYDFDSPGLASNPVLLRLYQSER
jgi:hypothetical protein